MTVETQFNMHETVRIPELNRNGIVLGFCYDGDGLTVRVRFFENAKPETIYFLERELEKAAQRPPPGFVP